MRCDLVHQQVLRRQGGEHCLRTSGHLGPFRGAAPLVGPDPSRVEKLANMQPPSNIKQVRSFLGLVNQLGKYSSDYAMITTEIRTLLRQGVKFIWTPEHQDEFNKVIKSLSDLDKLKPFDPKKSSMLLRMPASVDLVSS